jgi:hypothetical protein
MDVSAEVAFLKIFRYNRENAVAYARRWAYSRNPIYHNFVGLGGDCTNFISQCVYAGSCQMNYRPTFGWYYISLAQRSPSWTGVEFFYEFFIRNAGPGPFASQTDNSGLRPGDVVHFW